MSLETQLGYIYRAPFLILLVVFEQIFDSDGCTLNIRHVFFREKSRAKNVTASSGQTEENRREKRTQESFITLMHFVANVLSICAVSVPVPLSSNLFNFVFASFNSLLLLVLQRRITFSWRYTVSLYSSYICTVLIVKKVSAITIMNIYSRSLFLAPKSYYQLTFGTSLSWYRNEIELFVVNNFLTKLTLVNVSINEIQSGTKIRRQIMEIEPSMKFH